MLQHQTTLSNLGVRAMMALVSRTATALLTHDKLGTAAASRSTASEKLGTSPIINQLCQELCETPELQRSTAQPRTRWQAENQGLEQTRCTKTPQCYSHSLGNCGSATKPQSSPQNASTEKSIGCLEDDEQEVHSVDSMLLAGYRRRNE